jgi:hypothetical protein
MLGKLNPFQVLVMALIESAFFIANCYLGYTVLGAVDVGKTYLAMFLTMLGACNNMRFN